VQDSLNVTIIQTHLAWENPIENRSLFDTLLTSLKDTHLVVLPEMFTTGFTMNAEQASENSEGETLAWLQQWAKRINAAITGSVAVNENGNYYNRLYFVYPDGSFKTYDKKHLFTLANEHHTYDAGKERLIVEYLGWKICPLVCYDLRFPVWARNTEDYDALIYVANWPKIRTHAWDTLLKARAIENISYCIGVNRIGLDGNGYEYVGHSAVYNTLGELVSSEELETDLLQTVTLEKSHINKTRSHLKFLQDRDAFTLK
jgi:omega-amidase